MTFNELAQWSALVMLSIFVFGLTRQLGSFLTPPSERRADDWGPRIGDPLPEGLLNPLELDRVRELMSSTRAAGVALMVVYPHCSACETWYAALNEARDRRSVPLIALTRRGSPEYVRRLESIADMVVSDDAEPGRLRAVGLTASPFLLVADDRLRVQHKQLGGDPVAALASWDDRNGGSHGTIVKMEVSGNDRP